MKKAVAITLIGMLAVVLAAAATVVVMFARLKAVETEIDAIGQVTMRSAESIEAARAGYEALPTVLGRRLANYGTLQKAEGEYAALISEVDNCMREIDAIGVVDTSSERAIEEARKTYEGLSEDQKYSVANYAALIDAERQYTTAVEQAECKDILVLIDSGEYIAAEAEIQAFISAHPRSEFVEELKTRLPDVREGAVTQHAEYIRLMIGEGDYEGAEAAANRCMNEYSACSGISEIKELYGEIDSARVAGELKLAYDSVKAGDYESACDQLTACIANYPEAASEARTVLDDIKNKLARLRPKTGAMLHDSIGTGEGLCVFKTASGRDYLVKIESAGNSKNYILLYIRGGEEEQIHIRDGTYVFKYASGETWFGEKYRFGRQTSYTAADDTFTFKTTRSGGSVYYTPVMMTLYNVANGSLKTHAISDGGF